MTIKDLKQKVAEKSAAIFKKPAAALSAAAAVAAVAAILLFAGRSQVFSGIFKDQSGLAMVREGKAEAVKKEGARRETLRVYTNDATGMTNPAYAVSFGDAAVSSAIFEPLMRRDKDGSLVPVLAKKVQVSGDGTTYTIQLKKGLGFSDGTPVTAQDAAFSIAAMCAVEREETAYQNLAGYQEFSQGTVPMPEGVKTVGELELELVFDRPSPDNLAILETRIQKMPDNTSAGTIAALQQIAMSGVGTGPYVKTDTPEGSGMRLAASPNYRGKIRDIKTVEFVAYGTYEMGDAIEAGGIDVAFFSSDSAFFDLLFDGKQYTIYEKPLLNLYFLSMNRNNQYLYIPQVRQAMALSIDRDEYAFGGLSKHLVKADGIAPEGSILVGDEPLKTDEKKAKELIEGANERYGHLKKRLVLPILVGNKVQEELAKNVKSQLKKIDLTVDIEPMDQNRYLQQVYMLQDFDLILSGSAGIHKTSFYETLATDMQGLPIACNSRELDEAIAALENSYSPAAVNAAWKKLNTVCNRQVPVIPLARPKLYLAVSADLSGYRINQYDDFFENIQEIRVK